MTEEEKDYLDYAINRVLEFTKEVIELKKKNLSDINAILAYIRRNTFETPKTEVKEVDD